MSHLEITDFASLNLTFKVGAATKISLELWKFNTFTQKEVTFVKTHLSHKYPGTFILEDVIEHRNTV